MMRRRMDVTANQTSAVLAAKAPHADSSGANVYINRELSWLEFNQRVLDQALDDSHPLLERVKFLAIVGSNLDEFFMVRVATLLRKERSGAGGVTPDGMTVTQQLAAIRKRATKLLQDQATCWNDVLRPALAEHGILFLEPDDYTDEIRRALAASFKSDIYPLLTPLAFDPGHPFPLISNRSKNFAVVVRQGRRTKFARVKVPALLPRFVPVPRTSHRLQARHTFAFLEDVMRLNLGELFSGVAITDAHLFRVIRDTDMEVPDGADDLLETVDRSLKQLRHGPPSLLQVESSMPKRVLDILIENFEIKDDVVLRTANRIDFSDWMALHRLPLPNLKDAPFTPRQLWVEHAPDDTCVFDEIREQDFLVHHPFDSFHTVEEFLRQAATDRHVVAIKMTLYRIGKDSPLVDLLIDAADAGKQVAVLVELKARFDERNNIQWATRLEEAGIHVVYGVEQLKTHCKLCLVVRKETDGIHRYVHIGTGNYNRNTSEVYTDFSLFTANSAIVGDVSDVFNALTGYSQRVDYKELLVAPHGLRAGLLRLIDREIGNARDGRPGAHRHQEQRDYRPGDHPGAVSRVAGGRRRRSDRARRLLPASRRAGALRPHSRAIRRGTLSRALADVLLRERRRAGALHRQRRPDGAKSRSTCRDALPRLRSGNRARTARRRHRRLSPGQRPRLRTRRSEIPSRRARRGRAARQRAAGAPRLVYLARVGLRRRQRSAYLLIKDPNGGSVLVERYTDFTSSIHPLHERRLLSDLVLVQEVRCFYDEWCGSSA